MSDNQSSKPQPEDRLIIPVGLLDAITERLDALEQRIAVLEQSPPTTITSNLKPLVIVTYPKDLED